MEQRHILLLYHGAFERECLDSIAADISREFGILAVAREHHFEIENHYDPARRQYNADTLLKYMKAFTPTEAVKTIGLFRVDLFIPILTFLFGQAYYRGNLGVVSAYRLRNEQYGLKSDEALLTERLSKVVLHELGHAFGLTHCLEPSCVMRSSTYVEDIDQKKAAFCAGCRRELETGGIDNKFPTLI